jgi:hypothetical protein
MLGSMESMQMSYINLNEFFLDLAFRETHLSNVLENEIFYTQMFYSV